MKYTTLSRLSFIVLVALISCAVGCGTSSSGVGSANVSLSDPPSCSDTFSHVYVTIDGVSASVTSSDTSWQELASQLSSQNGAIKAVQLDLMHLPQSGQCLLAQLGSTQSLPVGDYGQMRLMLVPNNAQNVTLLPNSVDPRNNCASVNAWNCVVEPDPNNPGSTITTALSLSSQSQTGEKIPPGQIMGGPIHVADGQTVDINLDFSACRSILRQGNGQYRLDPALVAYQVSPNPNDNAISGQVVQASIANGAVSISATGVPGANVAAEVAQSSTDSSTTPPSSVHSFYNFMTKTDANGNFNFCPVPAATVDIVSDAGGLGQSVGNYNASILRDVPQATKGITIPLLTETVAPATLSGSVSATALSNTVPEITANLYALQPASTSLEFSVPLLSGTSPEMISQINLVCTGGTCIAPFDLVVPVSNPLVATFSSSITWQPPSSSAVSYKVEATCKDGSSATFSTAGTPPMNVSPPLQLTGCN